MHHVGIPSFATASCCAATYSLCKFMVMSYGQSCSCLVGFKYNVAVLEKSVFIGAKEALPLCLISNMSWKERKSTTEQENYSCPITWLMTFVRVHVWELWMCVCGLMCVVVRWMGLNATRVNWFRRQRGHSDRGGAGAGDERDRTFLSTFLQLVGRQSEYHYVSVHSLLQIIRNVSSSQGQRRNKALYLIETLHRNCCYNT